MVVLTIGCGISCSSFLSLATFAENSRVLEPREIAIYCHFGCFSASTAVSSRVTKMAIIAISRGYMNFQQMLRETNRKSKKFRIRWSKVPRENGAPKIELWPF